jgi:hypothetical protein
MYYTDMKYFLLPAMLVFSLVLNAQSASYFINEISYTASNPSEKGFEIVGTAGSQLTGWSAVQYHADGWQSKVDDLSNQIIPSQQNGYGTIWYDIEQGGDSGGLALVDPTGSVVQFVAYGLLNESSILNGALDGLAAGSIPEYIGAVSDANSAMQLVGTGNLYATFFWASTQTASLGQVNDNQFFIPLIIGLQSGSDNTESLTERTYEATAWPNPTTDFLQVKLPELKGDNPRVLCLYDQNGRQLIRQQVSKEAQQIQLELGDFSAGIYYVTVFSKDNQWQYEVVVK